MTLNYPHWWNKVGRHRIDIHTFTGDSAYSRKGNLDVLAKASEKKKTSLIITRMPVCSFVLPVIWLYAKPNKKK